jgi:FixJ family two-component response regulator
LSGNLEKSALPVVWIVDDSPSVRSALRAFLESIDVVVRDFDSAHDFLDAFEPDARGCIVTDFHMPGMDGIELLENLRARAHDHPVIVITGKGDEAVAERASRAGAFGLLHKPVDGEELFALIEKSMLNAG